MWLLQDLWCTAGILFGIMDVRVDWLQHHFGQISYEEKPIELFSKNKDTKMGRRKKANGHFKTIPWQGDKFNDSEERGIKY